MAHVNIWAKNVKQLTFSIRGTVDISATGHIFYKMCQQNSLLAK